MVNELRLGAQHPKTMNMASWLLPGGEGILPSRGQPFLFVPRLSTATYTDVNNTSYGNATPLYSYGDTLAWIRGRHVFKVGAEVRFTNSNCFDAPGVRATATFGPGGVPVTGISTSTISGLGVNEAAAQNLLMDLAGSLSVVTQGFQVVSSSDPQYVPGQLKKRDWHSHEMSYFFKDDFKVGDNWTLNLGVRYDYYSVPYDKHGLATAPIGGSAGLFGISGTAFADLYQPGLSKGSMTQLELMGKNSPNSSTLFYKNDWNNFGPAVGLSWSIPYFGRNKTVFRAGYSINYPRISLVSYDDIGGYGLVASSTLQPATYLDIAQLQLPLATPGKPLTTLPVTDRTQTVRAFDSNFVTPYIQSWNVTLQRELGSKLSLEVRYVGTKGSKLIRGTDVNEANIFENGILNAFLVTQAGGNSPLLDSIFQGLNLGLGVVNGTTVTGSASVRQNSTTRGFFANYNVGAFANFLNTSTAYTGVPGGLLRRAGLSENFVVANPQYATSGFFGNFANSTYNALQVQLVKRLSSGWNLVGNYTFSKTIGEGSPAGTSIAYDPYRDGRNRGIDKRIENFDRTHMFKSSWTYELPFGPSRKFLNSKSGFVSRLLERWQLAGIMGWTSGSPISISSSASTYNQYTNNTASLAGVFPKGAGTVTKVSNGVVFFPEFLQVKDPAIANLTSLQGLSASSTMQAVTDSSGNLIFVNPLPGHVGNIAPNILRGPSSINFDVNLVKRVRLREQMELELRMDAISALNHPNFGNPTTDINSTNFGRISSASGNRLFVLSMRLTF
jgi:hypothetical protein